jgi:hypothetical protein
MKTTSVGLALFLAVATAASAQQIFEEAGVVNVEIPVRVYQGNRFVDDLTIADFELFENGKPVPIEALYLVRRRTIERRDEVKRFAPQTYRSFYFVFEISEYSPKIGEAIDYFMQDVIMPGDSLTIATSMRTYKLKPRSFEIRTREEIAADLKGLLRRDAVIGSSEYRNTIAELENLAQAILAGMSQNTNQWTDNSFENAQRLTQNLKEQDTTFFDQLLNTYVATWARIDSIRSVDQAKMLAFAEALKGETAQKYVYLFYEREFVPKIEPKFLMTYMEMYQDRPDINQTITGIFDFYRRDIPFNVDRVKKAYADASTAIHFLMITSPAKRTSGIVYAEQSEDVFAAFSEMARATGGYAESSANASSLLHNAVEASETYYLLYYSPKPFAMDGLFRELTVRVKNRNVRVVHRAGYLAEKSSK